MAEGAADSAAAVGAGDDLDDLWGSFCTEARSSLWHKASPPRHAEGGGSPSRALRELAQFALPHDDLRFQQQLNRDLAAEGAFAAGHATHGGEHPQVDHLELDPLDEPAVIAHGLERGRPLDAALSGAVASLSLFRRSTLSTKTVSLNLPLKSASSSVRVDKGLVTGCFSSLAVQPFFSSLDAVFCADRSFAPR